MIHDNDFDFLDENKTALEQLKYKLLPGERVKAIIFGNYEQGYETDDTIPSDKIGKVLSFKKAIPFLKQISFFEDYEHPLPHYYAIRIFTNKRIGWVTEYDDSTELNWTPRKPKNGYIPDMPGY